MQSLISESAFILRITGSFELVGILILAPAQITSAKSFIFIS